MFLELAKIYSNYPNKLEKTINCFGHSQKSYKKALYLPGFFQFKCVYYNMSTSFNENALLLSKHDMVSKASELFQKSQKYFEMFKLVPDVKFLESFQEV